MNFDEIKEKMNAESMEDSQIPKNISALSASKMPIEKVRKTMRGDIISQLVAFIILFLTPTIFPLYPLAESFYYIILFVACLITLGFVIKMMWFLRKTKGINTGSRDTVINYIHDLQMTLEVYKTANIAGSLIAPLYAFAWTTGTKYFDESVFNNFITLHLSPLTLISYILAYLASIILFYFLTLAYTDYLYGIKVRKLQEILAEFGV